MKIGRIEQQKQHELMSSGLSTLQRLRSNMHAFLCHQLTSSLDTSTSVIEDLNHVIHGAECSEYMLDAMGVHAVCIPATVDCNLTW